MDTKVFALGSKSNDIQYDQLLPDLTCDHKLGERSKFKIGVLGKTVYNLMCLNERNTMISNSLL